MNRGLLFLYLIIITSIFAPIAVVGTHSFHYGFQEKWYLPFGQVVFQMGTCYWMPLWWGWEWIGLYWVCSGIILSLLYAYSLKGWYRSSIAWPISGTILLCQFCFPIMLTHLGPNGTFDLVEYIIPFPIPSIIGIIGLKFALKSRVRNLVKTPVLILIIALLVPCTIIGIEYESEYLEYFREYLFFILGNYLFDDMNLNYSGYANISWFYLSVFWLISSILLAFISYWKKNYRIPRLFIIVIAITISFLQLGVPFIVAFSMPLSNRRLIYVKPIPIPSILAIVDLIATSWHAKHGKISN